MKLHYVFLGLFFVSSYGQDKKDKVDYSQVLYAYEDEIDSLVSNSNRTPADTQKIHDIAQDILETCDCLISDKKKESLKRLKCLTEKK